MTETSAGCRPPSKGNLIRCIAIIAAALTALICLLPARAEGSWPTSREAQHFRFPPGWLTHSGVWCIHRHEAVDWHERRNPVSRGGMQIIYSTFASVGGRGDPADWSIREQVYRAFLIWDRDAGAVGDGKGSWREWTTASACGLA